jgi:hypothetical protein
MSFTYAQLKTAVEEWSEYSEDTFVSNIPLFIRLAEERILKNVQLSLFRKNATALTTSGSQYLAAPSDYLAPFSLSITLASGQKTFLEFKDPSFLQLYTPDATTTGTPKYYAQFDVDNFLLAPAPNAVLLTELHYMYRPTSITLGSDSGTTWLSENAEVAMLYGALLEGAIFMKGEPDVIQNYTQRFQDAINSLKMFGEAKEVTDEYRTGKVRRQKQ